MFDLREFVMDTLRGMKGTEPEYRVRQYALGWFQKDVLTLEDLAEVESWYDSVADGEETSDELD